MRACCRGKVNWNMVVKYPTLDDMFETINVHTVDFIMPVQQNTKEQKSEYFPFIPLVQSPGIAFYISPGKNCFALSTKLFS